MVPKQVGARLKTSQQYASLPPICADKPPSVFSVRLHVLCLVFDRLKWHTAFYC